MYDQSSKSVVKLKVSSFKGKSFKSTNSGHQRIFQLQNPCVLFYPSEPPSPGFLISPIKPYIIRAHNSPILFFFLFFFQCLSSLPVFISPLYSQHLHLLFLLSITLLSLLITTCSDLPANLLTSLFSFIFLPQKFLLSS